MRLFKKKQVSISRRRLTKNDAQHKTILSDIFRRNKTLINVTFFESSRTCTHHLTIKRRKVMSILFIVLMSAALLWALVSNFTANVVVSMSDTTITEPVDLSYYEKSIQDYLGANPISRLSFLLDQSALSAYISNRAPEVSSVTQQNMLGIGRASFLMMMRVPVAGWKINNNQYYVDSKGVPFEKNYFSTPAVQIVDDSGASLQTGTVAVSRRFLSFVGLVVNLAKASGYTVVQAILPSGTTRELEIRLKEGDFLVKLSIDRPVGEQIEDMGRAVQYFVGHNQVPEYIDVRVSGKAFYK